MTKTKRIICIYGPTAGGKSDLALSVAQEISGEIINADSMQVYADLKILTASPSDAEQKILPHHLYNFLDCNSVFNTAAWLQMVVEKIYQIDRPVLVGGTGLYFSSLINGISPVPDVDPAIRAQVRALDISDVQKQVTDCPFTDPQRLRRALEVQLATGKPISYFQQLPPKKSLEQVEFNTIFVNPPRNIIRERCAVRFHQMVNNGIVDEVKSLLACHPRGSILKAIGVPEITQYIEEKITKNQMIEQSITATCQYAKRQVTWFKHQLKSDVVLEKHTDFDMKLIGSSSDT